MHTYSEVVEFVEAKVMELNEAIANVKRFTAVRSLCCRACSGVRLTFCMALDVALPPSTQEQVASTLTKQRFASADEVQAALARKADKGDLANATRRLVRAHASLPCSCSCSCFLKSTHCVQKNTGIHSSAGSSPLHPGS